jgi:hypothetical protein
MNAVTGKTHKPPPECEGPLRDAALKKMTGRSVDFRPFRKACFAMRDALEKLGENTKDLEAEDRRLRVINSIDGVLNETDCGQTMIESF